MKVLDSGKNVCERLRPELARAAEGLSLSESTGPDAGLLYISTKPFKLAPAERQLFGDPCELELALGEVAGPDSAGADEALLRL